MITHPEGLDIPDMPTRQLALDAMTAVEELLLRGVILDIITEALGEQDSGEMQMRWLRNTHRMLRIIHSRASSIEQAVTA